MGGTADGFDLPPPHSELPGIYVASGGQVGIRIPLLIYAPDPTFDFDPGPGSHFLIFLFMICIYMNSSSAETAIFLITLIP